MDIFFEQGNRPFFISSGVALTFPSHFQNEVEIMYISEGSLEVTEGGIEYVLNAGDMLVIFPNREHSYRSSGNDNHIMLIFEPEWCGLSKEYFTNYVPNPPVIRADSIPPIWTLILKDMIKEYASDDERKMEVCRSYTFVIATQLLRLLTLENNSLVDLPLVNSVIAYCLKNHQSKISLSDLSRAVGVNKYHVSRIFSNRLGTTFCDYINSLRLNSALIKLTKTKDPITKIAFDCGFNSSRTFTRVFTKHMGISPNKYRIQNRKTNVNT